MNHTDEIERRLREHLIAERSGFPTPPGLDQRILKTLSGGNGHVRRSGFLPELALALAVVMIVGAVGIGFSWLRGYSHPSPSRSPVPKASGAVSPSPDSTPSIQAADWLEPQIAFEDASRGLVSFSNVIELTEDGGRSWVKVYQGVFVRQIVWVSQERVLAVSTGGLISSNDHGKNWTVVNSQQNDIAAVNFPNGSKGFAVSSSARLLSSIDGGKHFDVLPTQLPVLAVDFLTPELGWTAGPAGIEQTSDGGLTWRVQTRFDFAGISPESASVDQLGISGWSLHMFDDRHGFATYRSADTTMSKRAAYVFYTSDGGGKWVLQSDEPFFPVPRPLQAPVGQTPADVLGDIAVTGPASAAFLNTLLAEGGGVVVSTTSDGGRSWVDHVIPKTNQVTADGGQVSAGAGADEWVIWFDGSHTSLSHGIGGGQTWGEPMVLG
ncbi:MAG TPA: hypothetical protein VET26_05270 [Candidatus Sulfotelmatobacter sp.]|nr:hypothetical protein [Candidatus Sulfotelmatobacter sp.]